MRFGLWNVRSLYRAGSLMTILRELSRGKLDKLEAAEEYTFFNRKGNDKHELGTNFFVHKRIESAVKTVELVGDRVSYIIPRWYHIVVLNVHAPTEDKINDVKDSFYKELERCV
jgi:hypothetical protein